MSLTPLTSPFAKVELLEVSQTLKEELLARKRMSQTDGFGMQKEAPCPFVAVERIAHDGRMQSLSVRTVHAQLVCSPRLGVEGDSQVCVVDAAYHPKLRYRLLTLLSTHDLSRTVQIVGHDGQADCSLLCETVGCRLVMASDDGDISLLHLSANKLLL